jgi:ABC-2 type transport system permease protein
MDFPGTSSTEIRGNASFTSVALGVAWRYLTNIRKNPAFLLPPLIFPIFFLVAFAGGLSAVGDVPNFDYPDYTAFQFAFVLLQSSAFAGVFAGFTIAADFEFGFARRLLLAAPRRSGIIAGYALVSLGRCVFTAVLIGGLALAGGMEVDGSAADYAALLLLALLLNITATLFAAGMALRFRTISAAPAMQVPVFLILFLAPVYVPVDLLHGWIHGVAQVNPVTPMLEAARGLLQGDLVSIGAAFGCVLALLVLAFPWAVRGLRSAERAG